MVTLFSCRQSQSRRVAAEEDDSHFRRGLTQQAAHCDTDRVVADVSVPVGAGHQDQRALHIGSSSFSRVKLPPG